MNGARGLRVESVSRSFASSLALDDVSLHIAPGEVHALVGENGAGKSTLIRIACGMIDPDAGSVSIDDVLLRPGDGTDANARSVGVVHQHFMLVEPLTVADNVVLGTEPRRGLLGLVVDRVRAAREVKSLSERYDLRVDPHATIESLGVGEKQRVELLKVLYRGARYVLLDEPTAVLSPSEIAPLLETVRELARNGAGVLLVSHKLDEVLSVADRIMVLKKGRVVLRCSRNEADREAIARAVVGGEPEQQPPRTSVVPSRKPVLRLENVVAAGLNAVSLELHRGEVLGIAGVEGNGQRALARAIAGLDTIAAGSVALDGRNLRDLNVTARRSMGLGYVPEDRSMGGLMPGLSIAENLALGDPQLASGNSRLRLRRLREQARSVAARFEINPRDPDLRVGALSGGNAQKVLVARELSRTLRVLVIAQPTRGVDLGASVHIHRALLEARANGVGIVLIGSDLAELRSLSDRIAVMHRGRIVATFPAQDATDEQLGPLMLEGATPKEHATR